MTKRATRKSRAVAHAPATELTEAIESKADQLSNPLLDEVPIHSDLKPLFDALVRVSSWSGAIARCYAELLEWRDTHGNPRRDEWPDGDQPPPASPCVEPRWTELMRAWSGYYRDWCDSIATAQQAAKSSAVESIMDAGESRPAHRWTTKTVVCLDELANTMHPIRNGGGDGLGFIRCGLPPMPTSFHACADAVGLLITEIRAVGDAATVATAKKTLPPSDDEPAVPALTARQSRVLQTMAMFDTSRLLSLTEIEEETKPEVCNEEVRTAVLKMIEDGLAERPNGPRRGSRLTIAGRKLAARTKD